MVTLRPIGPQVPKETVTIVPRPDIGEADRRGIFIAGSTAGRAALQRERERIQQIRGVTERGTFRSRAGFELSIIDVRRSQAQLQERIRATQDVRERRALQELATAKQQVASRRAAGFGIPEPTPREAAIPRGIPTPTARPEVPVVTQARQPLEAAIKEKFKTTIQRLTPERARVFIERKVEQQREVARARLQTGRPVGTPVISERQIAITNLNADIARFEEKFVGEDVTPEAKAAFKKLQARAAEIGVGIRTPPELREAAPTAPPKIIIPPSAVKPSPIVTLPSAEERRAQELSLFGEEFLKEQQKITREQQRVQELQRPTLERIQRIGAVEATRQFFRASALEGLEAADILSGIKLREERGIKVIPPVAIVQEAARFPLAVAGGVGAGFFRLGRGAGEAVTEIVIPPGTPGRQFLREVGGVAGELGIFGLGRLRIRDLRDPTRVRFIEQLPKPPTPKKLPTLRDIATGDIVKPTSFAIDVAQLRSSLAELRRPIPRPVPEISSREFERITRVSIAEQETRKIAERAVEFRPFGLGKRGRPKRLTPIDIEPKPVPARDIERFLAGLPEERPRPFGLGKRGRPRRPSPLILSQEEQIRIAVSRLPQPTELPELRPFGLGKPGRPKRLAPVRLEPADQLRRAVAGLRPTDPVSEFRLFGLGRPGRPRRLQRITTVSELQRALRADEVFVTSQEELARIISGLRRRTPKPPKTRLFDKPPDVPPSAEFEKIRLKSGTTLLRLPGEERTREFQRLIDLERGRRFRITKAQREEAKELERLSRLFIPGGARELGFGRGTIGPRTRVTKFGDVIIPIGGRKVLLEDITQESSFRLKQEFKTDLKFDIAPKIKQIELQRLELIQKQIPSFKFGRLFGVTTKQAKIQRLDETTIQKQATLSLTATATAQLQEQKQATVQRLREKVFEEIAQRRLFSPRERQIRQRTRLRIRLPRTPRIPTPRFPRLPFIPSLSRQERKRRGIPEFQAFIRRRGEFVPVGKPRPFNLARFLGAKAAKETLGRTFIVRPTGRRTRLSDISGIDLSQFRAPRGTSRLPSGALVERAAFALTEEQPEIQLARRRAPKKLRKGKKQRKTRSRFGFPTFL